MKMLKKLIFMVCLIFPLCSILNTTRVFADPPLPDGTYYIMPKCAPGMCVEVDYGLKSDGDIITVRDSNPYALNQVFYIHRLKDGTYKIVPMHSDKPLEVVNGSSDNCARIQQWETHIYEWQRWHVIDCDDGYYRFVNKHTNKSMDVKNGDTYFPENGTQVWQYQSFDINAQKFKLVQCTNFPTYTYTAWLHAAAHGLSASEPPVWIRSDQGNCETDIYNAYEQRKNFELTDMCDLIFLLHNVDGFDLKECYDTLDKIGSSFSEEEDYGLNELDDEAGGPISYLAGALSWGVKKIDANCIKGLDKDNIFYQRARSVLLEAGKMVLKNMNCPISLEMYQWGMIGHKEGKTFPMPDYIKELLREKYKTSNILKSSISKIIETKAFRGKINVSREDINFEGERDLSLSMGKALLSISGNKKRNGKWDLKIKIWDMYDFNFDATGSATIQFPNNKRHIKIETNNLGYIMQEVGMIVPYDTSVEFDWHDYSL